MRVTLVLISFCSLLLLTCCASLESLTRHELHSGYYELRRQGEEQQRVYADVNGEDSISIYDLENDLPVPASVRSEAKSSLTGNSYLFGTTLVKRSFDVDLSTIVSKLRPSEMNVPPQLNSTINGVIYGGYRKDFYHFRSRKTVLNKYHSSVRQLGYDAGLFAGIGITPVNPWVTTDHVLIEYDGIVFQKGVAFFVTMNSISVGLACGFDNLLDHNSVHWIYNNRPWIGLLVGIANF